MLKMHRIVLFTLVVSISTPAAFHASRVWGQSENTGRARAFQEENDGENEPAKTEQKDAPLPRPGAPNLQIRQVSPEMMRVLENWERATSGINKLQLQHTRYVYDHTNQTDTQCQGQLYYEAPDKGRIEFQSIPINPKAISKGRDRKTGKPYRIQTDRPDIWICNGKTIWRLQPDIQEGTSFDLPNELQGRNIMDGPMPFLLGMPAKIAKQRFELAFDPDKPEDRPKSEIWLNITPRWPSDAANWSKAKLVLDSKNHYLPVAVKMFDPAGTSETVYAFKDIEVNKLNLIIWKTPFDVNQIINRKWKITQNAKKVVVPSLIGLSASNAKEVLDKAGFKVHWEPGDTTTKEALHNIVHKQEPPPRTELPENSQVTLWVYVTPIERKQFEQRKAAKLGQAQPPQTE